MSDNEYAWMEELIPNLANGNWLYKIVCFVYRKKLSYKEYYFLIYAMHRGKLGNQKAKEKAMKSMLAVYKFHHNNKMPNDLKDE